MVAVSVDLVNASAATKEMIVEPVQCIMSAIQSAWNALLVHGEFVSMTGSKRFVYARIHGRVQCVTAVPKTFTARSAFRWRPYFQSFRKLFEILGEKL
jgi:hypothetical protein